MTKQFDYDDSFNALCDWLNVWYAWGGNSKTGVDCSGLVDNWWETIGFWPVGTDATADAMFDNVAGRVSTKPIGKGRKLLVPDFGGLCFYGGSAEYAGHVTIAITSEWCIGATGGSRDTNTVAEAKARDAKVKVHKIKYRDDYHGCWMPDYEFVRDGVVTPPSTPVLGKWKTTTDVNFRSAPSLTASVVKVLASGVVGTETGLLPVVADGYTWINLTVGTSQGWCASKNLVKA